MVYKSSPNSFSKSVSLPPHQRMHSPTVCASCSLYNELEYTFGKPMKCRFQRCTVLSVQKYYQLLMHESNIFLLQNTPMKPLGQWGKRPQNPPFPGGMLAIIIHKSLGQPHSPRQTTALGSRTSTLLCNKVPTGYNGMPQIHPKNCPFPFDDNHPYLIHLSINQPHWPPKWHLDPISRFATILCRQTDRPTDRWSRRMFCKMSALLAMLIDSSTLAIILYTIAVIKHKFIKHTSAIKVKLKCHITTE